MATLSNPRLSWRALLKGSGTTLLALSVLPGGIIAGARNAWASIPRALSPESFATLIQACRDIYPHDYLADSFYAKVVEGFDAAAVDNADEKSLLENGVAALDAAAQGAHGQNYRNVGWEIDRVRILRAMESGGFFQKLRGSLVTGLYNNPDVWPFFGWEGESASKGGYINRGFDDIDWLDQV